LQRELQRFFEFHTVLFPEEGTFLTCVCSFILTRWPDAGIEILSSRHKSA
jgi:hypothetical protein